MSSKKPHILIFNPDQMRADALHHLGNAASVTPNMDKLLEDGVSFRNAFCQNPVCTPSRCSFMSGWYPHVTGHRTISYLMHEDDPVLLKELRDNGYYVWMNNRNDLLAGQVEGLIDSACDERVKPSNKIEHFEGDRGEPGSDTFYSFYYGKVETKNEEFHDGDYDDVQQLIEFIKNKPTDKPVCMFLGLFNPHPPYMAPEKYLDMIDRYKLPDRIEAPENWEGKASILKGLHELQNMGNWTEEKWNELRATYLAMCARVDYMFGMIVDALKEADMYDDTAIFIFSDHGDYTGDYGIVEKVQNSFEDCLTNVPFIVKPHKEIEVQPGINDALVELIDFYGTVEDFVGMEPTHTHFGKSLRNVLSGQEETNREVVFCEGGRLAEERHCTETAKRKAHLNKNSEYYPRLSLQASYGPEHTKATMCRSKDYKYVRRLYEQDELYDLKNDPKELNNLINDPSYKDIVTDLKEKTLTWYQETCDVVPFEEDDRFSNEMLLDMLRTRVSKEKYEEILIEVEAGKSIMECLMQTMVADTSKRKK